MSNVLRFPKAKRALPAVAVDTDRIKAALPRMQSVRGALLWGWSVVRLVLFLILYWLRLPVALLCNVISVPTLLAWLFAWYAFPEKTAMVWSFGIVSFAAFAIGWVYDFILMAIAPQDMMMTL